VGVRSRYNARRRSHAANQLQSRADYKVDLTTHPPPAMDHLRSGSKSKLYSVSAPPAYGWLAGDTSPIAFDPPTDSPAFPDTRGTTSGGATDLRNWRRTFGAVEAAARAVKEHSDVAIPLTAVVGAMSALVEYHDVSVRHVR